MKIRTDFVSNSSSSSFIIQDMGMFKTLGITSEDIQEILDKLLENTQKKWNCNHKLANVIPMETEDQKKEVFKKYDDFYENWEDENQRNYRYWQSFKEALNTAGFISDIYGNGCEGKICQLKKVDGKYIWKPNQSATKFFNTIKKKLEIHTMKDCSHYDDTTMLIKFGDNAVWTLNGMHDAGPEITLDEYDLRDPKRVEESKKSTWETEADSSDRFFEILFRELVVKKNIDIKNPEIREKLGKLKTKFEESVKEILERNPDIDLGNLFLEVGDYGFVGHEG